MLSFTGQGQLGKLGKLATFACCKRILENSNCIGNANCNALLPQSDSISISDVAKKWVSRLILYKMLCLI